MKDWNISTLTKEQIELECPMKDIALARNHLHINGFKEIRGGPKRISDAKIDDTIFVIIGEKVLYFDKGTDMRNNS